MWRLQNKTTNDNRKWTAVKEITQKIWAANLEKGSSSQLISEFLRTEKVVSDGPVWM